ncbi:hypothetical protein B0T16DRAFT_161042 [Cercophora newfieldiana]|uniref:Uncharacterized protein n=1 Tax=Cercophora newfieldiana TaxID=92897 RepID=A0AA39Y5P9_9PEZI|nr:hypothetical protein B0T16DRAFT_161042 [Cercophora newfieldiana]
MRIRDKTDASSRSAKTEPHLTQTHIPSSPFLYGYHPAQPISQQPSGSLPSHSSPAYLTAPPTCSHPPHANPNKPNQTAQHNGVTPDFGNDDAPVRPSVYQHRLPAVSVYDNTTELCKQHPQHSNKPVISVVPATGGNTGTEFPPLVSPEYQCRSFCLSARCPSHKHTVAWDLKRRSLDLYSCPSSQVRRHEMNHRTFVCLPVDSPIQH